MKFVFAFVVVGVLAFTAEAQSRRPLAFPSPPAAPSPVAPAKAKPALPPNPLSNTTSILPGLVIALVLAGLIILISVLKKKKKPPLKSSTGRMASIEEQRAAFSEGFGRGGYALGTVIPDEAPSMVKRLFKPAKPEVLRLKLKDRFAHILIMAATRAGKTTGYFVTQLFEDAVSGATNWYLVDRKGSEIAFWVAKIWLDQGHRVIYLNPWDMAMTWCCEPLWEATREEQEAIVQTMVSVSLDPDSTLTFYRENERKVLRALLQCAKIWGKCRGKHAKLPACKCQLATDEHKSANCECLCRRHFCSFPALAQLLTLDSSWVRAAIDDADPMINLTELANFWKMGEKDIAGTFNSLSSKFELWRDPAVARAFSRNDFVFSDVVAPASIDPHIYHQRTLFVVGASQSKLDQSQTLSSLMTRLIINEIYKRRDAMATTMVTEEVVEYDTSFIARIREKLGRPLSPRKTVIRRPKQWMDVVPLIMGQDESGTYLTQRWTDALATVASAACGILAAVQDESQWISLYGDADATALRTNFVTTIVLRGCSPKIAKEVQDRCGKIAVLDMSEGKSSMGLGIVTKDRKTVTERMTEQYVMPVDDILNLPMHEAIISSRECRPFKVAHVSYFRDDVIRTAVNDSFSYMETLSRFNEQCDAAGRPRPKGQPAKPPQYNFDWTVVPGIRRALQSSQNQAEARKPMSPATKAEIETLFLTHRITNEGAIQFALQQALKLKDGAPVKRFNELNEGEAKLVLGHLKKIEERSSGDADRKIKPPPRRR